MKHKLKTKEKLLEEFSQLRQRVNEPERGLKKEGKYRFIYDENPLLNIIVGVDGNIKEVNAAVKRYLGYSEEEVIGRSLLDFVAPGHREKTAHLLRTVLRKEKSSEAEVDVLTKNGSIRPILISRNQLLL